MRAGSLLLVPFVAALVSCAHGESITSDPSAVPQNATEAEGEGRAPRDGAPTEGLATWYGKEFAGRKTANGERFDPSAMTAAHRTLKFGTWVDVTRVDTGRTVRVRITDRGPFGNEQRIIDLSRGAAEKLGMLRAGVVKVKLTIVSAP